MMLQLPFRLPLVYAHQTSTDERSTLRHTTLIRLLAEALDSEWAYFWRGAHHFPASQDGDWTVAIRTDSAGRIRVETCHLGRVRGTKWSQEGDHGRIVGLALEARDEVLAEA